MKLSISNIAWETENDEIMYKIMKKMGFAGLEIAPTRIITVAPYSNIDKAGSWKQELDKKYGFLIASMQSIWYGRQENLFRCESERRILYEYTQQAINFAAEIGCRNLVFGCPKNRNIPDGASSSDAVMFFKELGDYAAQKETVIGMEANPPIYNTNYINDTISALELIRKVDSKGFRLNLDVGTMIENGEKVDMLRGCVKYINHVHISEPGLKEIRTRNMHLELREILDEEGYSGFISIEMGKVKEIYTLEKVMHYVKEIFD